jgi:hypothetical protein
VVFGELSTEEEEEEVMLRKTIVALFAIASIGMLAPDVASARGGFGGGGFHGGGFHGGGGFGGGGFRAAGVGMGGAGFRAAAISPGFRSGGVGPGFRAAAFSPGFRSGGVGPGFRTAAFSPGVRGGAFAANNSFRTGMHPGFRHHHHRGFPFAAAAIGAGLAFGAYPYGYYDDYYDYPYAASYYDDYGYGDDCYIVRKRIWTPYGWTLRRVQVCG